MTDSHDTNHQRGHILPKGRYLYDVRTEGGGGVDHYVTNTTDRLRECVTKGGGGPKSQKFCGRD